MAVGKNQNWIKKLIEGDKKQNNTKTKDTTEYILRSDLFESNDPETNFIINNIDNERREEAIEKIYYTLLNILKTKLNFNSKTELNQIYRLIIYLSLRCEMPSEKLKSIEETAKYLYGAREKERTNFDNAAKKINKILSTFNLKNTLKEYVDIYDSLSIYDLLPIFKQALLDAIPEYIDKDDTISISFIEFENSTKDIDIDHEKLEKIIQIIQNLKKKRKLKRKTNAN